jgi:hypothetical protein
MCGSGIVFTNWQKVIGRDASWWWYILYDNYLVVIIETIKTLEVPCMGYHHNFTIKKKLLKYEN